MTMAMVPLPNAKQATKAKGVEKSTIQGAVIGKKQLEVICGSPSNTGVHGFPRTKRGGAANKYYNTGMESPTTDASQPEEEGTTLTSLVQAAVTSLSIQPSIMQPMEAPPLATGDQVENYTIMETIVQGWLYKKGTGGDWAGSKGWKPRWVTLAWAENPDYIVPAPILLSHRAPGVPYPANIIELTASTVIMATRREDGETGPGTKTNSTVSDKDKPAPPAEEEWNRHCIQIVHTQHQDNVTTPKTTTRIFTAPVVERNEWVFAMNNALLAYVKNLGKARRSEAAKYEFRMNNARELEYEMSIEEQMRQHQQTDGGHSSIRSTSAFVNDLMGLPPAVPHPIRPVRSYDY